MIPERLRALDNTGRERRLVFTGKSGGEGAIYDIEGDGSCCAKIFFKTRISKELHEKILAMVKNPPGGGLTKPVSGITSSSIAWPLSPLYILNDKKTFFAGYEMPRVDTGMFKEVHMYYDTKDRLDMLGGSFSWRYLMTAAYNISFVVSRIHESGHCVGDFSPRNILVARTAAVSFIDCDSFQVSNPKSGKIYHTKVGTGEFLPPELMGRNFRMEEVNRHHADLFALGIMIFRLLMNGAHPYQAKGKDVWDLPTIEQKTVLGIYPYIAQKGRDIRPPGYAPAYHILPSCLRDLFSRCFVEGHGDPYARPPADEWCRCLSAELGKLKRCDLNPNHWYGGHLRDCPWCELSKDKGKELFPYKKPEKKPGKTIEKSPARSDPALIKTFIIRCSPPKFSFKTDSGTPISGRLEIETSGCRAELPEVASDAEWITDLTETGGSINRRYYNFVIRPEKIPGKKQGMKYIANILVRTRSETQKVPVEVGFSLKPEAEPDTKKIILRGFDLLDPPQVTFSVRNAGQGILKGTAESDREWLKVSPTSFSTGDSQEFEVQILPEKIKRALFHGNISIQTNGGDVHIPLYAATGDQNP